MRLVLQCALISALLLTGSGCWKRSSLQEGVYSFRAEDYRRAFIRLKPLADKGVPSAQYAIGYMYFYGQGVTEDRRKSWAWINRAARAGQPEAIKALDIIQKVQVVRSRPYP